MPDDYSDIATPVDKVDDYSLISQPIDEEPKSVAVADMGKRAVAGAIRGLGYVTDAIERLTRPKAVDAKKFPNAAKMLEEEAKYNPVQVAMQAPGQAARGLANIIPVDPARNNELKSAIAEGIGSGVPAMGAALINPALAVPVLAGQMGEQQREEALSQGDTEELANEKAKIGRLGGAVFATVPGGARVGAGALERIAIHSGKGALVNAAQDALTQEAIEGKIDTERVKRAAAVGAGMGGVLGAPDALAALKASKPKSIIPQVDDASSKTNPVDANATANEIATKPAEPIPEPIKAPIPQEEVQAPLPEETPVKAKETAPSGKSDYEQYQEIQKKWADEIKKNGGDPNSPVIAELWARNEEIKNRNGGMPPEPPKATEAIEPAKTADIISNFDKEWEAQGGQGGSENQVIFKDGKVYKRNYNQKFGQNLPQYGGDIEAFKDAVKIHNNLFPSTKITIEGFSNTSDGPAPITSQVEVKGTPASPKEIRTFMQEKDFKPNGEGKFVNEDTGIQVEDLRGSNVLKDKDGNLHVIDPVIRRIGAKDPYAEIAAPVEVPVPAKAPLQPALPAFELPKELAGAKPRYSYGAKQFNLKFDSDLDKALYIIAQKKPSARDADYLNLVMDHMGVDEAEARAAGADIRSQIKQLAKDASHGETISIPDSRLAETNPNDAIQIQSPESVPVSSQAEASQAVGQEVRGRGVEAPEPRQEEPVAQAGGGGANGGVPPGQVPAPSPSFNNPLPNQGWTPFLSKTKFGQMVKLVVGTIEGNIRKVAPEVFGALRERGFKLNELKKGWHDTSKDYGEVARKYLKPEAFTDLDRLLQSGLFDEASAFIKGSRYEPQLTQAIESFKKTLDSIKYAEIEAGREVGNLDNYWLREVADYEGLRREIGRDPSHAAEKALKKAEEQKGRKLTTEEEEQVINNLVSLSISGQGKPGFLNARTIGEIQKNWFKYYEPSDVAMENRINRAARDVVNRAYFGKFDPDITPKSIGNIEGTFGEIINRMIKEGKLSAEGSKIVVNNLKDFFLNDSRYDETSSGVANSLRKAQTYAYLGDMANAIPQYGDFFLGAWRNGLFDASKGFFTNRKFKLADIGVHEGNPDTAVFSKKNSEGLVGKVFRNSVNLFLGVSDRFNKGGLLNTSFHEAARDIRNPNSRTFKEINARWSERFPDRWTEILKDLQDPKFAKGELTPNTRFFLYSELADLQPISGESTAQAFNRSGPWGKILYGLRSFAIKQIDVMRQEGYEKIRDPKTRAEGLKNLVTYALIVGAGQQFVGSYLRDKLLDRDTDPSEYAVSGLLQLMGFNRYTLYRAKEQGVGTAALEMAVPGVGILNDMTQSLGVARDYVEGRRSAKTGAKLVPTFGDALANMEVTKYIPGVGREVYSYFGLGRKKEEKRRAQKAGGRPQPSTVQQISDMIVAPDKKN